MVSDNMWVVDLCGDFFLGNKAEISEFIEQMMHKNDRILG
jgi:hypothetical protein